MICTLQSLSLRNFKGIERFDFHPRGESVAVLGTNGSGKTTLADAFTWTLFGKDSQSSGSFELKTLDSDGVPTHGLDHQVEAILSLPNGDEIALTRTLKEVYTQRRGSAKSVYTGNTQSFEVNGVPKKAREYVRVIEEIMQEETWILLTDPLEFAERIPWKSRRNLLISMCGDVSDGDVIVEMQANPDAWAGDADRLRQILGNHSLEDRRAILATSIKATGKEMETIPARIGEVKRGMPGIAGQESVVEENLLQLRQDRTERVAEVERIKADGLVAAERNRNSLLQADLAAEQTKLAAQRANQDIVAYAAITNKVDLTAFDIESIDRTRTVIDQECFQPSPDYFCAKCEQALPSDQALAQFETDKTHRLGLVNDAANLTRDKLKDAEAEQCRLESAKIASVKSFQDAEAKMIAAEAQLSQPKGWDGYNEILEAARRLQIETNQLAISRLDDDIPAEERILASFGQLRKSQARIKELLSDEKRLSAELESAEGDLFAIDEFTRAKIALLEDRINSRFKSVSFRMFRKNINGGSEERCDVTVDGVPYSSLSNGERIKAGLEIIPVLQNHWGFAPPVWIDQAESFVRLPEMDCQQILLKVSGEDEGLRIEKLEPKKET